MVSARSSNRTNSVGKPRSNFQARQHGAARALAERLVWVTRPSDIEPLGIANLGIDEGATIPTTEVSPI